MYSEETITALSNRIGFGIPLEVGFPFQIEEANSVGSNGRIFVSFHELVTLENIYAATTDLGEGAESKFNNILTRFKYQATKEVVPMIMDKNSKYDNSVDYNQTIEDNAILFDDAIGYRVAMKVLEYLMSTKESNLTERNAKLSISNLKLELEGYKNEAGIVVATGLGQRFNQSVKVATEKIFPFVITVNNGNAW